MLPRTPVFLDGEQYKEISRPGGIKRLPPTLMKASSPRLSERFEKADKDPRNIKTRGDLKCAH